MSRSERMRSTASCTVRIAWMTRAQTHRPGISEQDLRLEREAIEIMSDATTEVLAAAQLFLEWRECPLELRDLGCRHGFAASQARQKTPFVFVHRHVR